MLRLDFFKNWPLLVRRFDYLLETKKCKAQWEWMMVGENKMQLNRKNGEWKKEKVKEWKEKNWGNERDRYITKYIKSGGKDKRKYKEKDRKNEHRKKRGESQRKEEKVKEKRREKKEKII
jgi:hypothetical protein